MQALCEIFQCESTQALRFYNVAAPVSFQNQQTRWKLNIKAVNNNDAFITYKSYKIWCWYNIIKSVIFLFTQNTMMVKCLPFDGPLFAGIVVLLLISLMPSCLIKSWLMLMGSITSVSTAIAANNKWCSSIEEYNSRNDIVEDAIIAKY